MFVETSKPPIDAETNLASPSDLIEDDAFKTVAGLPLIVAGVKILFADTAPKICTVSLITPLFI